MKIGFNSFRLVNTCFIDRPHVDEAGKVTGYLVPVLIRDEFEPDEEEHGGRFIYIHLSLDSSFIRCVKIVKVKFLEPV
jgi:hypothetical protein